jgi:hypothetical protein
VELPPGICEGRALPKLWRYVDAAVQVRCGGDRWRGRHVVAGGDGEVALQHRGVKGEAKGVPKWKGTELWWRSPERRKTATLGSEIG